MSWCDKLASTPTVGFAFDAHTAPSATLLAALAPVFDKWVDGDKLEFTVDGLEPYAATITSNSGFRYSVNHSQLSVEFIHRLKMRPTSAGPPVAELTSTPMPFTTLLPDVSTRLIEATMLLPEVKTRKLLRVGVVSSTGVDEDLMPPGILRFINYIGRPWQGSVGSYNIQISTELGKSSGRTDKCVHFLVKTDNPDQLPLIKFDWQRWFDPGRAIHPDSLTEILRDAIASAMAYLEDLAEGSRFDENILRTTA